MKSFLEYMAEVEAPKSELDKKVFALHPVKIKEYPVANAGERDVKTSKDKSRKADQSLDGSKKTYGLDNSIADEDSETPLYKPATDVAKQKIMKYFRSESVEPLISEKKSVSEETVVESEGSYNASFYGQFKRRVTKHEIPSKKATIGLTDSPDKTSEDAKKAKERLLLKVFGKKDIKDPQVNEVSYDRLGKYMDANDKEYNADKHDGNQKKALSRNKNFSLAVNKRAGKAKVPAKDE